MTPLATRVAVALAAVSVIVMLGLDVAFVLRAAAEARRARDLRAQAAVLEARAAIEAASFATAMSRIAGERAVALTLVRPGGERVATESVPLPRLAADAPSGVVEGPNDAGGYSHFTLRTERGDVLVASAPLEQTAAAALRAQGEAVPWFVLAGVAWTALGVFLLRRSVLRPLHRLTDVVGRADIDALTRFGDAADDLGRLSHAIAAMRERIAADKSKIEAQLRTLNETQQQLVRAERLAVVGQLAAGVAHEIGNPLAVLAGFTDVLRDRGLSDADREQALARMTRELDRIQATVRSLLDFSRAPAHGEDHGDVAEAITHVRELLRPQDKLRGVELRWPAPAGPLIVPLSVDALTQLLLNLLLNAADAVAGGGRIAVDARRDGERVTIIVEDSGPGVPAEVAKRVFEPFFTTKPKGTGTGLGLAVCERIATAAGGDIELTKSGLGGAAFRVTLPARAARAR